MPKFIFNFNIHNAKKYYLGNNIAQSDIIIGYEFYTLFIKKADSKRYIKSSRKDINTCSPTIKNFEFSRDTK